MSQEEKKDRIAKMAEKFMDIPTCEGKPFASICMVVYMEGKEAGREEEREKQKKGETEGA